MAMCWGLSASLGAAGIGAAAAVVTARRGRPAAVQLTLGYFAVMEVLQAVGYLVIDQCANPVNQTIAYLSVLHIAFQPFFINAFAMELVPVPVRSVARLLVYCACALAAAVMLLQLYPFDWAGSCRPGSTLCGPAVCTVSGEWHLGWEIPYNGLMLPLERVTGVKAAFPAYAIAAFAVPVLYGAWRFTLFHLLAGPILASLLTGDPNEMPAVWCLFSIGIILIGLSPWLWRRLSWGSPDGTERLGP
jgi:Family of unknown function (DUF5765)